MKTIVAIFSLFLFSNNTYLFSAAGSSNPVPASSSNRKRLERSESLPIKAKKASSVVRSHSALSSLPTQLNPITATAARQGARPRMEDTFYNNDKKKLWGVYDGHGGTRIALQAKEKLHKLIFEHEKTLTTQQALIQSFAQFHEEIKSESYRIGTTATVALVRSGKLYVANVGDSRAVLCVNGHAQQVSIDHNPDLPSEQTRIESLGGEVSVIPCGRIFDFLETTESTVKKEYTVARFGNSGLAVSRALGNVNLGDLLCVKPDIYSRDLNGTEDFLIIASDGLWDVMSNQAAVDLVKHWLNEGMHPLICANNLVDKALALWNHDNVTATIIFFDPAIITKWTLDSDQTTEDDGYSTEELLSSFSGSDTE
ncbi:protein phosphatase 2C domain-containing protein [Candidatus Babeliales bacterium]|nr:protein phosphatase 2C domain-containing protein [Candidatus Babeliales bacterium]